MIRKNIVKTSTIYGAGCKKERERWPKACYDTVFIYCSVLEGNNVGFMHNHEPMRSSDIGRMIDCLY